MIFALGVVIVRILLSATCRLFTSGRKERVTSAWGEKADKSAQKIPEGVGKDRGQAGDQSPNGPAGVDDNDDDDDDDDDDSLDGFAGVDTASSEDGESVRGGGEGSANETPNKVSAQDLRPRFTIKFQCWPLIFVSKVVAALESTLRDAPTWHAFWSASLSPELRLN